MANIAPQYHNNFNGAGGLWYELEEQVRERVRAGEDLHIIAGTIFDETKTVQVIGKRSKTQTEVDPTWNIGVPHGFFKIIINAK